MSQWVDSLYLGFGWKKERLGEGIAQLASILKLGVDPHSLSHSLDSAAPFSAAEIVEFVTQHLCVESEPISILYGEEQHVLDRCAPAILCLQPLGDSENDEKRYLILIQRRRQQVELLAPDLSRRFVDQKAIAQRLVAPFEQPLAEEVTQLTELVSGRQAEQVRLKKKILSQRLKGRPLEIGWIMRAAQSESLIRQLSETDVVQRLAGYLLVQLLLFGCWYGSWFFIGRMVIQNRFDAGFFSTWALLLMTLIPLRALGVWLQGEISIRIGVLIKRRLMAGALKLNGDEIRRQGIGQLLSRVNESEAVESLLFAGGFLTLTALIELVYAGVVLVLGSGGWLHLSVLIGWGAMTGLVAYRYFRHRESWTDQRLEMTHDLVEQMLGHRTRQLQGSRSAINRHEDDLLSRYFEIGKRLDRSVVRLSVGMPRLWLIVGLLPLFLVFLRPDPSAAGVAIAIGGTVSAYLAFQRLTSGLIHLTGAYVATERIIALWQAAGEPEPIQQTLVSRAPKENGAPLLIGRHLSYRYPSRPQPVIRDLDLEIARGDRLVLKGGSGSGKSTLANLLAGLRQPDSGLLLLEGYDYRSLGAAGWQQRIASAPQFHENHVLTETFAFNLLMGRRWPPTRADVEAAYRVCDGLGLTPLLERMPGGMFQMVGETGWQLSHGERNRLFLARAILQGADLLIIDESLAGLDPETYLKALETIEREAETVIMISHR